MADTELQNIQPFQLETFREYAKILVLAKRGCGSGAIAKNIIRFFIDKRNYDNTIIMSADSTWENFYPYKKSKISLATDTISLQAIWNYQKNLMRTKGYGSNKLLIVLDSYEINSILIQEILMNSRHYSTTILMTIQNPNSLSPVLRSSFDFIFICKETNCSDKMRIYNNYVSIYPNFQMFSDVFDKLTQNFRSMVVNYQNMDNLIMWFKAKKHKELVIDDWNKMQIVLKKDILWNKLPKDLKNNMINFFYKYSF
jgi:hypothetical protein